MRYHLLIGLLAVGLVGGLSACDFVQDIDQPTDRVNSDSLDSQAEIGFLATGVKEGFNDAYDNVAIISALLSDVGVFNTRVRNATFPTYGDIDRGEIQFDNNSIDNVSTPVNEYRFQADDLVRRVNETITFVDDPDLGLDAEADRTLGLYTGYFHGAVARYFLATYFSKDGVNGGAPISTDRDKPSQTIPASELYAQALGLLAQAAPLGSDYDVRVINTLRARIALFQGDYDQAADFAAGGLVDGDAPYSARFTSASANEWYSQAGRGRTQISIAPRFAAYDEIDSRTLVERAPNASGSDANTYYRQALYTVPDEPLPFLTWQENSLILAEAALLGDTDADAAVGYVNPVLESRGIDPIADGETLDRDLLIQTRDRELFTQGLRLVDQRRFGLPFTYITYPQASGELVEQPLPGIYRYFPLTQTERNANPEL